MTAPVIVNSNNSQAASGTGQDSLVAPVFNITWVPGSDSNPKRQRGPR